MKHLLLTACLLIGLLAYSQDDDYQKYLDQQKAAFDQYKSQTDQDYQKYIEKIDREFAAYLKENWAEFETEEERKEPQKPKPKNIPTDDRPAPKQVEEIPAEDDDLLIIEDVVVAPTNYNEEVFEAETDRASDYFFGDNVSLLYDVKLINIKNSGKITPESISKFWLEISATEYKRTLQDIQFYQQKYNLNDYGTFLLISNLTDNIFKSDSNTSRLASWYFLSKMGFQTKVGYNSNAVYLMFPSQNTLYGVTYVTIDETKYYLLNYDGNAIYTYPKNYGENQLKINFLISKPIKLKDQVASRAVSFEYKNRPYSFDLKYNKNAIEFYKKYPHVSLQTYFGANPSLTLRESILQELGPVVEPMQEIEALSFLLRFVQKAFPYQIDDEQFGYEKAFFPEEFLHYPYSDCEDRSIFFSYLVKVLLNKEVIGLNYPKHVATAVNISDEIPGKYYALNGKRFIVCDPTFINAPVGSVMTKFTSVNPKIIN